MMICVVLFCVEMSGDIISFLDLSGQECAVKRYPCERFFCLKNQCVLQGQLLICENI